jgi:hypothetical protein
VEALRQGYAPKRIAVKLETQTSAANLERLISALRESRAALIELCLSDVSGRELFQPLVQVAAASDNLKTLDVEYGPRSPADWEVIWSVAGSHPTLSTVRVRYRNVSFRNSAGFNLLRAIEAAARSNKHLTLIDIITNGDETYHEPRDEGVQGPDPPDPSIESNRIVNVTNEIKRCADPAWGGRLFAVAVHRLCKPHNRKDAASLSCLLHLFRGNPDCLERCTRVPDALRRLWSVRMRHVDALLGEVLQLERRMAAAGVEIPPGVGAGAGLIPFAPPRRGLDRRRRVPTFTHSAATAVGGRATGRSDDLASLAKEQTTIKRGSPRPKFPQKKLPNCYLGSKPGQESCRSCCSCVYCTLGTCLVGFGAQDTIHGLSPKCLRQADPLSPPPFLDAMGTTPRRLRGVQYNTRYKQCMWRPSATLRTIRMSHRKKPAMHSCCPVPRKLVARARFGTPIVRCAK